MVIADEKAVTMTNKKGEPTGTTANQLDDNSSSFGTDDGAYLDAGRKSADTFPVQELAYQDSMAPRYDNTAVNVCGGDGKLASSRV